MKFSPYVFHKFLKYYLLFYLCAQIPELAGFWMLSLLLQCPLQIFLLVNEGTSSQPAEEAVQAVMFIMLILELIFGFIALKQIAQHRANNFHLTQLHSNDVFSSDSPQLKQE